MASSEQDTAKAVLLQPGKPYEFTIEMYPTSLGFQSGHRIRLDISSSNFPRFDVNQNTGGPSIRITAGKSRRTPYTAMPSTLHESCCR
jgi:predicted acyl esterase